MRRNLLTLLAAALLVGCWQLPPVVELPPSQPPIAPPPLPPPPPPPEEPVEPPPPVEEITSFDDLKLRVEAGQSFTRSQVEAALGMPTSNPPENPGEKDSVRYTVEGGMWVIVYSSANVVEKANFILSRTQ